MEEMTDLVSNMSSLYSHYEQDIADEVDEYFRKKFRKISLDDALKIASALDDRLDSGKIQELDGKFWIWETLEEAIRPHIDELSEE